jgi:undecaprenyl diphosphate synthase
MQRTWMESGGLHVGVVMDGNGRWALARGLPRRAGHRAGARVVRSVVESAPELGIEVLTLYAFSSDNWSRPAPEVGALMRIFRSYLAGETARCVDQGVRLVVIGRRDRLAAPLVRAIEAAESATLGGRELLLRIAIDYSARDAMVSAAARAPAGRALSRDGFSDLLAETIGSPPVPDVDLLIRTGGEQRLSDFLLWECGYAELRFERAPWPEFGPARLRAAVADFRARERRFGGLSQAVAG